MRKKFLFIFIVSIIMISNLLIGNTYASELTELLNECKSDLGDLEEFKAVVELVYTDLDSAEAIDDNLKNKLYKDIDKLDDVSGINKLASSILKQELKNQIAALTEANVEDYKNELKTVIEWAEKEINNNNEENIESEDGNLIDDDKIIEEDNMDNDVIVVDEEINDNYVDEDIINKEQNKIITTVGEGNTTNNKIETSTRQENISRNETKVSTENDKLPYTGILNLKNVLIIVSILILSISISASKYRKYNGI